MLKEPEFAVVRSVLFSRAALLVISAAGAILLNFLVSVVHVAGQGGFEPPKVTAELILGSASFERSDDSVTGTLLISNASNLTIEASVRNASQDFTITFANQARNTSSSNEAESPLAVQLSPYSSTDKALTVRATDNASFGDQKINVLVSYTWIAQGDAPAGSGATSVAADVKLLRHFEEETGIVDGGASALYFLLPLLLLFTAFVVTWSWFVNAEFPPRLRQLDLKSFPLLVLAAALVYAAAERADFQIYTGDLPSDSMLLKIVLCMTAAGSVIPLGWWFIRSGTRLIWGFNGAEDAAAIINKAITGPKARVDFEQVTVKVRGTDYKGILIEEREKCFFLAPTIQVTPGAEKLSADEDRQFESEVLTESGEIRNRKRLAELARQGKLETSPPDKVQKGGKNAPTLVCRVDGKLGQAEPQLSACPLAKAAERG